MMSNRWTPRTVALAALAAALLSPARPGVAEEPGVLVDAPAIRSPGRQLEAFGLPRTRGSEGDDAAAATAPESLASPARALLEKEVAAAGGTLEDGDAMRIRVIGPAAAADLVRKRCTELQRALDGTVVLDVAVVRLPAGAETEPSRDALAALVRAGGAEVLFGERLAVRRGETAHRDAVESRTFVASYESEVAQYASAQAPVTRRLLAGRRLAVQARTLPSGRAAVTVALHVVAPVDPMRRVTMTCGAVDLPEARFTSLCAPFVLAKGETGAAVVPDAAGDGHLLLRVTLAESDAPRAGPQCLVDLRAFAGDHTAAHRLAIPGPLGDPGDANEDADRDNRLEACVDRLVAQGIAGTEFGNGLRLVDAAAADQVEREFADALRTRRLARKTLRLPSADLAKAAWWDPLTGRPSGESPAATGAVLRLPVRGDTPAVWMSGTWRRTITSAEVEIAEGAVGLVPDVSEHFAGETVLAGWAFGSASIAVDHRTAALLDPAPLAGKARTELSGTGRTEDVPLDGFTTAISRSRIDVGAAGETTLRREGADAVISWWTVE